ncbi:ACT domain-containing protein [Bacillus sp. 31A1R]|uniref:Acetolactate synthase small subunit n=1 Tax=Robertmurraya mangrovi TaxID=3098077 RepID=A0ABU5IYW4_9BACI|nr:ACT domain-containing protein [Bacillus sp. 31A1R]MDZ5472306.1 ACT domain-containing protein [Bacillus sp. 31A1R]
MNQTFSLVVTNDPGVLLRVSSVFARRGYNISSLHLNEQEMKEVSQMKITAACTESEAILLVRQLNKLIDVRQVEKL